ncbi:hypothetical protein TNCV_1857891 [Trichonephila clavipes]|nr:hypothetical protein TNCV_1857891 [Trichonephila clavipes]
MWLYPPSPNFEGEYPEGSQGPSTNHTRGLAARRVLRVPPCREAPIHLQTSMPSPGFKPRRYGTAVSVTNHCTGWAHWEHPRSNDILGLRKQLSSIYATVAIVTSPSQNSSETAILVSENCLIPREARSASDKRPSPSDASESKISIPYAMSFLPLIFKYRT